MKLRSKAKIIIDVTEFSTQCTVYVVALCAMMDVVGVFTKIEEGVGVHVAMLGSAFDGVKCRTKGCTCGYMVGFTAMQGRSDRVVYLCLDEFKTQHG